LSPLWLAPATFVTGSTLAANAYFTRLGEFKRTASSKISQSVINGSVTTGVGLAAPNPLGFVLGDMVGKAFVIIQAAKLHYCWGVERSDTPRLGALIRKFADFPKYSIFGGLLNNGGSFLTPFALFHIFGAEAAGQYHPEPGIFLSLRPVAARVTR
jgi:O-antigen/teichoic acid export membrane protein